jgi:predicted sugar kinase
MKASRSASSSSAVLLVSLFRFSFPPFLFRRIDITEDVRVVIFLRDEKEERVFLKLLALELDSMETRRFSPFLETKRLALLALLALLPELLEDSEEAE